MQENGQSVHDIAIIGGGVVGCALLRRFALSGARVVLLERERDLLSGASKGNSAILHTGFDAPPASLELACIRAGYAEYLEIRERLNLPLLETSALLVAWNDAELARLPAIVAQARDNGVGDVVQIDLDELYRREPNLAKDARGAVLIPGEHVIDPWSAPLAYALQGIANGGVVHRNTQVTGGHFDGSSWTLETDRAPIRARTVINAAGLHGDLVERIARPSPFTIHPRKGQFVLFDKPAARLVRAIILPVPTERTKGVIIARTAFGNVLVGPTAEDQDDRETAACDEATLASLIETGCRLLPGLAQCSVTATYAGLRPATGIKDYWIEALPDRRWITVGGIRSTGLTAALGIARHVAALYASQFEPLSETVDPIWTPVPNLAEHRPRPYQQCASEIVCHCELVTRDEIEAALSGPLPAGDLGGLKRRTRCMMGRCQGFYCSRRVAELAGGRLPDLPAVRLAS